MTNPGEPGAHLHSAAALIDAGRLPQAEAALRRALARSPRDVHAMNLLAITLLRQGQAQQAAYFAERVVRAAPEDSGAAARLGAALLLSRDAERAVAVLEPRTSGPLTSDALELVETLAAAYNTLMLGAECVALADRCIERRIASRRLLALRAAALLLCGRADDSLASHRELLLDPAATPGDFAAAAAVTPYAAHADPASAFELFRSFARSVRSLMGPPMTAWSVSPDPNRQLHAAFVSPDLRNHAMAFFIEPLVEHFDRTEWRLSLFSTSSTRDHVTERMLRAPGVSLHSLVGLSQRGAAELAARLQIDVLIDFAGHTTGNVLQMLALKPAPVQITAVGFPTTTGLDTVDYRLVDSITDPPGSEPFNSERLLRMEPCFLTYRPHEQAPPLTPPPSARDSHITFGSFAALQKVTEPTLDLWCAVLRTVPHSRLLYRSHATRSPGARAELARRMLARGVHAEQLMIEPPVPDAAALLPEYARVDVALDSFPYHGTTTTCEATWMGVPVVTLAGNSSASRVGCSILSACAVPEFIARSPDEFVSIAAALALDEPRRLALRGNSPSGLRDRMRASPLCDHRAQCARLAALVRAAWRDWCRAAAPHGH